MFKKLIVTLVVFGLFGALTYGVGLLAAPDKVALPAAITSDTLCPVAACTQPDGACHKAQDAPIPNGSFTMICPKIENCSDTTCHAWDRLTTHYNKPSDISLNLWVLAPVVVTVCLVLLVRKMR